MDFLLPGHPLHDIFSMTESLNVILSTFCDLFHAYFLNFVHSQGWLTNPLPLVALSTLAIKRKNGMKNNGQKESRLRYNKFKLIKFVLINFSACLSHVPFAIFIYCFYQTHPDPF